MHTLIRGFLLICAAITVSGCASVPAARFAHVPNVRTVTSIGDKPVSVVAGLMGESVTVGNDSADLRVASEGQISGRVLDDRGQPASNAEVRVAVGGASAGRLVRTRTDEAGGFTLHGLRPDASYTLIAERDDAKGPQLVGQQVARAPSRRVLISLADPNQRASARPSARVRPASDSSVFDDELEPDPPFSVNDDDLPLPDEAPVPTGRRFDRDEVSEASMTPDRGWRRGDPWPSPTSEDDAGSPSPDLIEPAQTAEPTESIAEEEVNPLPPAIAPPEVSTPPGRPNRQAPTLPEPDDDLNALPPAQAQQVEPPLPAPDQGPDAPPIPTIPGDSPETRALDPEFSPEPVTQRDDPPPIPPAQSPTVAPPTIPELPSAAAEPAIAPPTIPEPDPVPEVKTPDPAPVEPPSIPPAAEPTPEVPNSPAPEPEPAPAPAPSIPPVSDAPPIAEPPNADAHALVEPTVADTPSPTETPSIADPPPISEVPAGSEPPTVPDSPFVSETEPTAPELSQNPEPPAAEPEAEKPGEAEQPPDAEAPQPDAEKTASKTRRPTWGDVDSKNLPTLARSSAPTPRTPRQPEPKRSANLLKTALGHGGPFKPSCRFDSRQHRLVDFQLPDLQGRPVHFKDLDADLVLIDFWGSWCGPCVQSIPRLVDLQSRLGPERLRVVGVAYEQGTPAERTAAVEAAAQRLGINYTVLLGEADGQPCPLQEAFQVQAFPTLVLLDRHGRILWRDQGATQSTLERLERVVASNASTSGVVRR